MPAIGANMERNQFLHTAARAMSNVHQVVVNKYKNGRLNADVQRLWVTSRAAARERTWIR